MRWVPRVRIMAVAIMSTFGVVFLVLLGFFLLIPVPELSPASPVCVAVAVKTVPSPQTADQMYLDLLKKVLTLRPGGPTL